LPIVRTSPDHGTAFAIAGKHKADYKSSLNAIELAIEISQRRKKSS
jgi:4-hydroxythreonine-4-phosphate dehydrogenase